MIKVKVTRLPNKLVESIEVSGHANSGPHGQDLVCAAVSAITFGTYNAIEKLCAVTLSVQQGKDGGYLYFTVPTSINQQLLEKVQLLLEGMLVSLQTIEMDYEQYIKIYN